MRERRVYLVLAVVLIGGAIAVFAPEEREPWYNGKRLSEWIEDTYSDSRHVMDTRDNDRAEDAIRHMGTNALPYLLKWLETPSADQAPVHLNRDDFDYWLAAVGSAIGYLGPEAKVAVPELIRLMAQTNSPTRYRVAAQALTHFGPEALGTFVAAAANKEFHARSAAIGSIGTIGLMYRTNAAPAIPVLLECLKDADSSVAGNAAFSLGMIHLEPALAVPALTNLLGRSNAILRLQAARALAYFGTNAVAALPALEKLLDDPDERVRADAAHAVRRIRGK